MADRSTFSRFAPVKNDRGQSLITKYVWVIETIYRRRKISFKELNEIWLRDEISRGVDIPNYKKGPRIYALDRIQHLRATEEKFEMPKDWTAKDFFEGYFGIIAEQSVKIQPVKLKVSAGQANYIRDLKMHESQEEIERNEEYSIFTFNLRPEFDFQQELLWNGEDMEVLEPLWLRKEIAGKIKRMWNKYKEDK